MKKNKKEISLENLSADSLVKIAREQHEKVMEKAETAEKAHKKTVIDLTRKEKGLKEQIKRAKSLVEKMSEDFEQLEKEKKEENLADIKADVVTEDEVRSGKISIAQFQAQQGMKDDEIYNKAMAKTQEDLEKSRDLVRSKGAEIVRLELELYETQSSIYSLQTQPVRLLQVSYKELNDMLIFQLAGLTSDGYSAKNLKIEKQDQITLIEKEASLMSQGFVWRNLTLKEASRLQLDPILPKRLVGSLLEKLSEIEGSDSTRVTITFHQDGSFWPGDPLEIRIETE